VLAVAGTLVALGAGRPSPAQTDPSQPLPSSTLSVRTGSGWRIWWSADRAPTQWGADTLVTGLMRWRRAARGVRWAELPIAGSGEAWRTRVIVARLDPRQLVLSLDTAFTPSARADWSLDRVPDDAVFAVNAGQFVEAMPWGWVVLGGHRFLPPARGPLAVALVWDSAGDLRWQPADDVARDAPPGTVWAFESYPVLLAAGRIPAPLQSQGRGVDLAHRDARLALGRLSSGDLVIALTRFDAMGESFGAIPFGLTVPEMAALMGALGCVDAVLLDGGISAQMLVRDADGATHWWRGIRTVPLALVARERTARR